MKLTLKQRAFALLKNDAYGWVYLITNQVNSKKYVGVTTQDVMTRFRQHCKADSGIGRAIRKYGEINFLVSVLDYADSHDDLMKLEIKYIKRYGTYGKGGYNRTLGGDGASLAPDLNIQLSEQQQMFVEKVNLKNIERIDPSDSAKEVQCILSNLLVLYLTCKRPANKIYAAKLIGKLKTPYKNALYATQLECDDEVKHHSCQKASKFEVFSYVS